MEEIEQKKRWLKRYRKNRLLITRLEDKLLKIDERLYKIKSPNFSGEPRGGTPPTQAELISDKMEIQKRIDHLNQRGAQIKAEILDKIDELDDVRYAAVLEAYFIDGLTFEEIAEKETGYTVRHVLRLYSEALRAMSLT